MLLLRVLTSVCALLSLPKYRISLGTVVSLKKQLAIYREIAPRARIELCARTKTQNQREFMLHLTLNENNIIIIIILYLTTIYLSYIYIVPC